jgi:formylglycine-generating enzyme required for sulfatase activity
MRHLHVFLSSPGDVHHERQLAVEVLERLNRERTYRDRLKLEVVAWDKPGAGAAMPAQYEPQEAIARGLRPPSQCDIVIVIFWARMGTPLSAQYCKADGSRYRSGTEYEFLDALAAAQATGSPDVLVYRRQGAPAINLDDPKFNERRQQWEQVEAFFTQFKHPDGSWRRFYKEYHEPSGFKELLDQDLRDALARVLEACPGGVAKPPAEPEPPLETPLWEGSPFPGLRAFRPEEALIFFGRGRETDGLIRALGDSEMRFIAVVGASGSGKSSLVAAGLLPALARNAIAGSQDWVWVRFTPAEMGDDPFMALASAFKPRLDRQGRRPRDLASDLEQDPGTCHELLILALEDKPDWAELLLFIDQFEEIFTLVEAAYRQPFVALLARAAQMRRVRLVVTMRADFYHHCLDLPGLDELLVAGHYPLLAPRPEALSAMITRPAAQAGLRLEAGLAERILDDTGLEPGALALMAFALSELWRASQGDDGVLTFAAYDSFNGVYGAIGKKAEDTFNALAGAKPELEAALADVFRELVEVDERGVATRRRAPQSQVGAGAAAATLVNALIEARLLVTSHGEDHEPMVEVAHEAIFSNWPRLQTWIEATGDDLRLRRQVSQAAAEWQAGGQATKYLWPHERVVEVVGMLARLGLGIDHLTELERDFLGPIDRQAMLADLDDPATSHEQRATIGVRLALLGDPRPGVGLRADGLPDMVWCEVPGGDVTLEMEPYGWLARLFGGSKAATRRVESFYIAKYPVTWVQYRAFLDADDGFRNPTWWEGLLFQVDEPGRQFNQRDNHPAENLCWLEAVAFCRWLAAKLGYEIRLPTEWEWQQAASGGDPAKVYPWGAAWDSGRANTYESGLSRSTAVGLYPHGVSPVGVFDMSGNVWEWCLNQYDNPHRFELGGEVPRVVRGGSWGNARVNARASYRAHRHPGLRSYDLGRRVGRASPVLS